MENNEQYQRIEDYLSGKMSGSERVSFESKIARDSDLAKRVAAQKRVFSALQEKEVFDFKNRLTRIRQQGTPDQKKTPSVISLRRVLAVAASLVLLIGTGYYLFNFNQKTEVQNFAGYFELKPEFGKDETAIFKNRGEDESFENSAIQNWKAFLTALQSKDFENAYLQLGDLRQNHSEFSEAIDFEFYTGIIEFYRGDYRLASQIFKKVAVETRFYSDALWYSAGAAFHSNDHDRAKKILTKLILSGKGNKIDQAKKLLADLNNSSPN